MYQPRLHRGVPWKSWRLVSFPPCAISHAGSSAKDQSSCKFAGRLPEVVGVARGVLMYQEYEVRGPSCRAGYINDWPSEVQRLLKFSVQRRCAVLLHAAAFSFLRARALPKGVVRGAVGALIGYTASQLTQARSSCTTSQPKQRCSSSSSSASRTTRSSNQRHRTGLCP